MFVVVRVSESWDSDIVSFSNVQGEWNVWTADNKAIRPVSNLIMRTDDRLLSFTAFLQERSLLSDDSITGCVYLKHLNSCHILGDKVLVASE